MLGVFLDTVSEKISVQLLLSWQVCSKEHSHICCAFNFENGCQEKHPLAHAFHDPSISGSFPAMGSCIGAKKVGMTVK